MADNTSISWAEATWNPVLGCDRVSPGCDACYAITDATIRAGNPHPKIAAAYAGLTERRGGRRDWTGRINLLPERLEQPLRWKRPRRIFVNSMSDLFHDNVPDLFITQVFQVMEQAHHHAFQLLTKRHARMRAFVKARQQRKVEYAAQFDDCPTEAMRNSPAAQHARHRAANPPANIWLGVSVEDQKWADIRIPALLDTPAAVRWLSCEPLLGPVDLSRWLSYTCPRCGRSAAWTDGRSVRAGDPVDEYWCQTCGEESPLAACDPPGLGWVVVGGESGPGARPMHPDWARSLRDQCTAAGVPFHFKQWGAWSPRRTDNMWGHENRAGWYHSPDRHVVMDDATGTVKQVSEIDGTEPPYTGMFRVGKKAAGRELDGREWDEYPSTQTAVPA